MRNEQLVMKGKKYSITFVIVLLCVLLFGGCENNIEPPEIFTQTKNQTPVKDGYGRIKISFAGDESAYQDTEHQEAARTVFPSIDFDTYVYTFTKTDETTPEVLTPDNEGYFTLEIGSYTVTVYAYIGVDTLAASGVSAEFNVGQGENNPIQVLLSGIDATVKGSFSYTIAYPQGATAEITLKKWPGLIDVVLDTVSLDSRKWKNTDAGIGSRFIFVYGSY